MEGRSSSRKARGLLVREVQYTSPTNPPHSILRMLIRWKARRQVLASGSFWTDGNAIKPSIPHMAWDVLLVGRAEEAHVVVGNSVSEASRRFADPEPNSRRASHSIDCPTCCMRVIRSRFYRPTRRHSGEKRCMNHPYVEYAIFRPARWSGDG